MFSCSCWLSVQKGTIWSFVVPVLLIAVVRSKTWSAKAASPESCNILSISILSILSILSNQKTLPRVRCKRHAYLVQFLLYWLEAVAFKWSLVCQLYHYSWSIRQNVFHDQNLYSVLLEQFHIHCTKIRRIFVLFVALFCFFLCYKKSHTEVFLFRVGF